MRFQYLVPAIAFGLVSASAIAATDTQSLSVEVAATVTMTRSADMEFEPIFTTAGQTETVASSVDANYDITGDANAAFSVDVSGSDATLSGGGLNTMGFTVTPSAATGTFDASGNASFTVAGELQVTAIQQSGTYTGDLVVTVDYQ